MQTFSDGRLAAEEDARDLPLDEIRMLSEFARRDPAAFCREHGATGDALIGYSLVLGDFLRAFAAGYAA